MMTTRLAVLMAFVASACSGAYVVNYRASYGADMVPASAAPGLVTSIRYRDYGGALSKALLLILSAPQPPQGHTDSKTEVSKVCGYYDCTITTTTTTTYTPPTAEELAAYRGRARDWADTVAPAILSGAYAAEAVIDVASTSLGGDTSGGMAALNFRVPTNDFGPFLTSHLSLGLAVGAYTTHGRTHFRLREMGSSLVREPSTAPLSYTYVGMPLRFTGLLHRRLASYLQLDMNTYGWFGSERQPQIVRAGLTGFWTLLSTNLEVSADRLRRDSFTASVEVGLAF